MAIYNHGLPIPRKKVESGGVDTSADTVTPETLVKDYTAHDKDGNPIVGVLDVDAVRDDGYAEGQTAGYNSGYAEGHEVGEAEGYSKGETAGYNSGYAKGEADGTEAGIIKMNAVVQLQGMRTDYNSIYMNWSGMYFKPQYDIKPTNAYQTFSTFGFVGDLSQYFDDNNIVFDTSSAAQINYLFISCPYITRIGTISSAAISSNYPTVFHNCQSLTTIDKIILHQNTAKTFDNLFIGVCPKLTHLRIEGVIGASGFNVSWSPLNKASLTSIVNALSATTTGLTVTLRLAAVNTAFETSPGAADGSTSDEWLALAATKANWTISLINS